MKLKCRAPPSSKHTATMAEQKSTQESSSLPWTVEAMLCREAPPPVDPPEDKEEYERLKAADPRFEREFHWARTPETRKKVYQDAYKTLWAREEVARLIAAECSQKVMLDHLTEMINLYLGGTPEFEEGRAYLNARAAIAEAAAAAAAVVAEEDDLYA